MLLQNEIEEEQARRLQKTNKVSTDSMMNKKTCNPIHFDKQIFHFSDHGVARHGQLSLVKSQLSSMEIQRLLSSQMRSSQKLSGELNSIRVIQAHLQHDSSSLSRSALIENNHLEGSEDGEIERPVASSLISERLETDHSRFRERVVRSDQRLLVQNQIDEQSAEHSDVVGMSSIYQRVDEESKNNNSRFQIDDGNNPYPILNNSNSNSQRSLNNSNYVSLNNSSNLFIYHENSANSNDQQNDNEQFAELFQMQMIRRLEDNVPGNFMQNNQQFFHNFNNIVFEAQDDLERIRQREHTENNVVLNFNQMPSGSREIIEARAEEVKQQSGIISMPLISSSSGMMQIRPINISRVFINQNFNRQQIMMSDFNIENEDEREEPPPQDGQNKVAQVINNDQPIGTQSSSSRNNISGSGNNSGSNGNRGSSGNSGSNDGGNSGSNNESGDQSGDRSGSNDGSNRQNQRENQNQENNGNQAQQNGNNNQNNQAQNNQNQNGNPPQNSNNPNGQQANGNNNNNGPDGADDDPNRRRDNEERKDGAGNVGNQNNQNEEEEKKEEEKAQEANPPEEVKEQNEKKDDDVSSNGTILSDIPFEEEQAFGNETGAHNPFYNFFEDNFLLLKSVQWQKDSHGLFDYEMRQIIQSNFRVLSSKIVLRKGSLIRFEDPGTDIKAKYGDQYQELFKIHKVRNKYFIEGVKPDDPSEDIDNNYLEGGEPTLPPFQMRERMYNVIRYLKQNSTKNKQDYLMKKNDIIKIGRVKFKVSQICIKDKIQRREQRVKRRKQRVEAERKKLENGEGQIERYPSNYEEISLGSDKSYYEPLVGESNYIEAKVPQIREEAKQQDSNQQNRENNSLRDIEPAAPQSVNNSLLADVAKLRNIGVQTGDSNQIPLSNKEQNQDMYGNNIVTPKTNENPVDKAVQTEDSNNQDLKPRNQRDLTDNNRAQEEEEKKQEIIVQPSSILQQIQRELMGGRASSPPLQSRPSLQGINLQNIAKNNNNNPANIIALNKQNPSQKSSSSVSSSSLSSQNNENDPIKKMIIDQKRNDRRKRRAEKEERKKQRELKKQQELEEEKKSEKENCASAPSSKKESARRHESIAQSENIPQCRLCWDNEFTVENPLLQICQCRGGVEYIHFNCIKSWLKTKEYRHVTTHYTSIYWRQFQCEICKSALPYVFRNAGRSYSLIELPEMEDNYLILESISLESKHSRMVHILHPKISESRLMGQNREKYLLGRGQDCDLKVSDISVSRNHCVIHFRNGKFYLQDQNSKFGTLALTRGRVEILPDTNTGMQIGRTLMIFQTRPITRKEFQVGEYVQEKNEIGRKNYLKERNKVKEAQKKDDDQKNNNEEFDFDKYIEQMEEEYNREKRMELQRMDHEWLREVQNDDQLMEEQRQIEANIRLANQNSNQVEGSALVEQEVIQPREVWKNQNKSDQVVKAPNKTKVDPVKILKNSNESDQVIKNPPPREENIEEEKKAASIKSNHNSLQINEERKESRRIPQFNEEEQIAQQKRAEEIVKETEKAVQKLREQMGVSDELKKLEELERIQKENKMKQREAEIQKKQALMENQRQEQIKQFGEGRIFISIKDQQKYVETQKARNLHNEHRPMGTIQGQKAPVKVAISRNFADQKKKEENINAMKKYMEQKKEEDKKPASQSSQGSDNQIMNDVIRSRNRRQQERELNSQQIRDDINSFEDLEKKHQELVQSQSQIHKGLQDIWRMQLLRQREHAERLQTEEKAREELKKKHQEELKKKAEESKKEENKKQQSKEEEKKNNNDDKN